MPAFLACAVALLAGAARADIIKLKDGRTIEGKIVSKAGGKIIVQITERMTFTVKQAEVAEIEERPFEFPKAKEEPAAPGAGSEADRGGRYANVAFVQVSGAIDADLVPAGVRKAIRSAVVGQSGVLVVELDTPGGLVDSARDICAAIERSGLETVAWVRGDKYRGAFSAGALIALSCDRIYMEPGTSVGAATPFIQDGAGAPQVTEKMISALSATARGLAERHGHSPYVASAMVDPNVELREAKMGGKCLYLPPDQVEAMVGKGAEAGNWLVKRGSLLTLTAREACAVGFAAGLASTRKELVDSLGIEHGVALDTRTDEAIADTADKLAEAAAKRRQYIRKLDGGIATLQSRAMALEPGNFTYTTYTFSEGRHAAGDFVDGGREWKGRTEASVGAYDACLELCRRKLKYAREYPDLEIDEAALKQFMVNIKVRRDAVAADWGRRGLPR